MANVVLAVHGGKDNATDYARQATSWLTTHGHRVLLPAEDADVLGMDHLRATAEDLEGPVDLAVALGGDGTVLRTIRLMGCSGAPVLSVNFGRLGYLTEVEPEAMCSSLERVMAGECGIEERMMLEISIQRNGEDPATLLALNEAVLEKPSPGATVHLSARIGGRAWTTYVGDGMIVATPTGSTAYSFSARGPIVSPRLRAIVLTPVSPHMAFDRSLVMSEDEPVLVEVTDDRPAALTVDGGSRGTLARGDAIVCGAAEQAARFITFGERDFFGVLKTKFKVADR